MPSVVVARRRQQLRGNVAARLAMHGAQPFQKLVNVVRVENTWQQRFEGWSVSHCASVSTSRLKMFHECDNFSVV